MVEALRPGAAFRNLEFQIEQPDGQRRRVLVNIDPLRDEAGTIIGAINCFQDVTRSSRRFVRRPPSRGK